MKKYWNIAVFVMIILLVVGALLIESYPFSPSSPYDRIPLELKGEMLSNWPAEQFDGHLWGHESIVYYGTHKDCVVFSYRKFTYPYVNHRLQVAGHEFAYSHYFEIIVYRGGEYIQLEEAYQRGWLSERQIASIAQYHKESLFDVIGY